MFVVPLPYTDNKYVQERIQKALKTLQYTWHFTALCGMNTEEPH